MKELITLVYTFVLSTLGILLVQQPFTSFISYITMNDISTATCNIDSVQTSLRIWLDPIPASPAGALPPGVTAPVPQPQSSATHALHLELTLVNASQNAQAARVTSWSWSQGNQTNSATWNVQPELSPLNRYSQVQRQLVELQGNQRVTANMELEINGQPCQLQVQVQP